MSKFSVTTAELAGRIRALGDEDLVQLFAAAVEKHAPEVAPARPAKKAPTRPAKKAAAKKPKAAAKKPKAAPSQEEASAAISGDEVLQATLLAVRDGCHSAGEIGEAVGLDAVKAGRRAKKLVSLGALVRTGSKRHTQYWLPGTEPEE